MKNLIKFMSFAAIMLVFAACEEDPVNEENTNQNPSNPDAEYVSFNISDPSWDGKYVTYTVTATVKKTDVVLSTFMDSDLGQNYSFGIGYFPVSAESGMPKYFNGNNSGTDNVLISNENGVITFTSTFSCDNKKQARAYVYLMDAERNGNFYYSDQFYIEPNNGGGGDVDDIGVAMPEYVSNTTSSLTVKSHFTGTFSSPEPFKNASCGFIWCLASEGAPTLKGDNYIDCTQSAWSNQGQYFEGTISGLEEGESYNVVAYLKITPESELVTGDWCTFKIQNNGGGGTQNDTNWISLNNLVAIADTVMEITITAYFDSGDPSVIGVCYNTTGNPTENDNIFNAMENMESVTSMVENNDGSRTVKFVMKVQPNTTYYMRGIVKWAASSGYPTLYSSEILNETAK